IKVKRRVISRKLRGSSTVQYCVESEVSDLNFLVKIHIKNKKGGHVAHHNTQSRWSCSIAAAASSKGRSAI
ncbi:hypothetical protein CGJ69_22580, partial [Vibrio parahaemolyticus]